ncbi:VPA1262 family N-terminal domain-containing protein [Granulicella sp. S190]|uniref:VPA1262 family N-terminal domain-containing protein n=1 Tax=Granulicella sp. S190 TaxID=1747226 RepID=UPI0021106733|nr:VPA1262 family N-terminal domain-containing protein [Granulicella sp. S190]
MAAQESEFADAFDWAVVRLATYFPASASQARLLFGSVSLLTRDRPRPLSSKGPDRYTLGNGKRGVVIFRRTVLRAQDAIAWYRNAGERGITTPVSSDSSEVEEKIDDISLSSTSFEDDPQWPSLGVPLGTDQFLNSGSPGDPAPFRGSAAPRVHRRFGDSTGFEAVTSDNSAIRFLKRRLHLDLLDYSEYLGGLALAVPDPILRSVNHFLIPAQDVGGTERIVYRLTSRPGQSFDDLKLTVLEHRSNLLSRFQTVDVPADGLVTIESVLPFDQTGYVISHPVQGIIAYQEPVRFIRSISVSYSVMDSTGTSLSSGSPKGVGKERDNAIRKVVKAEQRRIGRAAAKRYKQTWFDGGEGAQAISFLKGQLVRARLSVMIADPYFGADEIYQFLQAVPDTQVEFTILTSRLAFEGENDQFVDALPEGVQSKAEKPAVTAKEMERLKSFEHSLAALHKRVLKSVAALVLDEETPPLHDRFLVIDNEVLFLGNSLNTLGVRASLILSVPDYEPILIKLRSMISLALSFEVYASRRRATSVFSLGED